MNSIIHYIILGLIVILWGVITNMHLDQIQEQITAQNQILSNQIQVKLECKK